MQKIINLFRLFAGDVAKFFKDYLILIEIIFIPAFSIILPAAVQTKVKKLFLLLLIYKLIILFRKLAVDSF
jgi:hypothetical protein